MVHKKASETQNTKHSMIVSNLFLRIDRVSAVGHGAVAGKVECARRTVRQCVLRRETYLRLELLVY